MPHVPAPKAPAQQPSTTKLAGHKPGNSAGATLEALKKTRGLEAQRAVIRPAAPGEHPEQGSRLEHATHAVHEGHLAGHAGEKVFEPVGEAAEFAKREAAARRTLSLDSKMQADLRLMRRRLQGMANRARSSGGAKSAAKLAEAREAYAAAVAERNALRGTVAEANKTLDRYRAAAAAGFKGAAMDQLGKAAAAFEEALQSNALGRGLLSTGRFAVSKPFVNGLMVLGAGLEAVSTYRDSPATTTGGKVANALLGAGANVLVSKNLLVAGADMLTPQGYKPSEVGRGTAAALTSIGEGLITGDTRGMEAFHERSKSGGYGKVMQAASEAGDYWDEKGIAGGLAEFAEAVRWWLSQ